MYILLSILSISVHHFPFKKSKLLQFRSQKSACFIIHFLRFIAFVSICCTYTGTSTPLPDLLRRKADDPTSLDSVSGCSSPEYTETPGHRHSCNQVLYPLYIHSAAHSFLPVPSVHRSIIKPKATCGAHTRSMSFSCAALKPARVAMVSTSTR